MKTSLNMQIARTNQAIELRFTSGLCVRAICADWASASAFVLANRSVRTKTWNGKPEGLTWVESVQ